MGGDRQLERGVGPRTCGRGEARCSGPGDQHEDLRDRASCTKLLDSLQSRRARNPVTVRVCWGVAMSAGSAWSCTATCRGSSTTGAGPTARTGCSRRPPRPGSRCSRCSTPARARASAPVDARAHPDPARAARRTPGSSEGLRAFLDEQASRARDDARQVPAPPRRRTLAPSPKSGPALRRPARRRSTPSAGTSSARVRRPRTEAGRIELLSCNATHGYHPLVLHDSDARAGPSGGPRRRASATSGFRPRGRVAARVRVPPPRGPGGRPPVHGLPREVAGTATLFADEGVQLLLRRHRTSCATPRRGRRRRTRPSTGRRRAARVGRARGWSSELEPHRVVEPAERAAVRGARALPARSASRSGAARSATRATARYLEFHKRHGLRRAPVLAGHRRPTPISAHKQPYHPDDVAGAVHEPGAALLRAREGAAADARGRAPGGAARVSRRSTPSCSATGGTRARVPARGRATHAPRPGDRAATVSSRRWTRAPAGQGRCRCPRARGARAATTASGSTTSSASIWEVVLPRRGPVPGPARTRAVADGRDVRGAARRRRRRQLLLLQASDWPFVDQHAGAPSTTACGGSSTTPPCSTTSATASRT